jgi:hypothetical protein
MAIYLFNFKLDGEMNIGYQFFKHDSQLYLQYRHRSQVVSMSENSSATFIDILHSTAEIRMYVSNC